MKFYILSGEQVIIFIKDKLVPNEKPIPQMATVHKVHRGIIVVSELESYNGLAKIVVHGTSKNEGHYWYEYKDKDLRSVSVDVTRLQKVSGEVIKTERFIED